MRVHIISLLVIILLILYILGISIIDIMAPKQENPTFNGVSSDNFECRKITVDYTTPYMDR